MGTSSLVLWLSWVAFALPTPSPVSQGDCGAYRQVGWSATQATKHLLAKAATLDLKATDVSEFLNEMKARDLSFVQLPEEALPAFAEPGGTGSRRYGHSDDSMHWTELGKIGGPGGILIRAKPEKVGQFEPEKFHVPPHTHTDPHVSVVLEGEGAFFTFDENGATYVPVRRGSVVTIPAGVGHTFWAGKGGIKVLALTDKVAEPDSEGFATKFTQGTRGPFTPLKEASRVH